MDIGKTIKIKRIELDMQQKELAERLGISQAMLSQVERGVKIPNGVIIKDLSLIFNCTADELLA